PRSGLIRQNYRPTMLRQPLGRSLLVVPREAVLRVRHEVHIVRRVGVDEVVRFQWQFSKADVCELPAGENRRVVREVVPIVDVAIPTERHIETTRAVETTEAVVA